MTTKYHTVAFYNLENLFDTFDDKFTHDDDFLPNSNKRWTEKRYRKKVRKLGYAISHIGIKTSKKIPAIIGLAEVENKLVIDDLLNSKFLKSTSYDYVHYDSPDERGIDVALLYDTNIFEVINSEVFPLDLFDEDGSRDYTRDILMVEGALNGERMFFIVNHWPSRSGGETRSKPKRMAAAKLTKKLVDSLQTNDPYSKIIILGDFNDNPNNDSFKDILNTEKKKKRVRLKGIYNPYDLFFKNGFGTTAYRDSWSLFDQILITKPLCPQLKKNTNALQLKP